MSPAAVFESSRGRHCRSNHDDSALPSLGYYGLWQRELKQSYFERSKNTNSGRALQLPVYNVYVKTAFSFLAARLIDAALVTSVSPATASLNKGSPGDK